MKDLLRPPFIEAQNWVVLLYLLRVESDSYVPILDRHAGDLDDLED